MQTSIENKITWRIDIEYTYVVLCKFCIRKIFDPDKTPNQTFYKGKCPYCKKDAKKGKVK